MSNSTSLIFALFTLTFFQFCKHPETKIHEIDKETKEWVVFQPGTWWLYKNLRTLESDTWKVVSHTESVILADEVNASNFKVLKIHIQTRFRDTFYIYVNSGSATFVTSKHFGLSQLCFFNSSSLSLGACDNNKLNLTHSDTTDNVCTSKVFDMSPLPCTSYFPSYYFWERKIGIKQMIYFNGDTLKLVDQNIIQ